MLFLTILTRGIYGQTNEVLHGVNSRSFQIEMAGEKKQQSGWTDIENIQKHGGNLSVLGQITGLEQLDSLNDERLRRIIFPDKLIKEPTIDFKIIHRELKRKNMTLKLKRRWRKMQIYVITRIFVVSTGGGKKIKK